MKHERVKNAKIAGNKKALSIMGAAGGFATAERRRITAEHASIDALASEIRQQEEMMARAQQANEHIVPIDSNDD